MSLLALEKYWDLEPCRLLYTRNNMGTVWSGIALVGSRLDSTMKLFELENLAIAIRWVS